ncbi:YigZ family protein [Candidatus Mycoplasma pogonae]
MELIVKKSTFISHLYLIKDKKEIKLIIEKLNTEYKKANHICYAYLLLDENNHEMAGFHDAGEPKGTAGMQIYNLLRLKKLNNVLVVVIRYFGGIKLGGGGLSRAYRESAALAIENYIKNLQNN